RAGTMVLLPDPPPHVVAGLDELAADRAAGGLPLLAASLALRRGGAAAVGPPAPGRLGPPRLPTPAQARGGPPPDQLRAGPRPPARAGAALRGRGRGAARRRHAGPRDRVNRNPEVAVQRFVRSALGGLLVVLPAAGFGAPAAAQQTRAERTGYAETSSLADV